MPVTARREDEELLTAIIDSAADEFELRRQAANRLHALMKMTTVTYPARLGIAIAGLKNGDRGPALRQQHAFFNLRSQADSAHLVNAVRILFLIGDLTHARTLFETVIDQVDAYRASNGLARVLDLAILLGDVRAIAKLATLEDPIAALAGEAIQVLQDHDLISKFEAHQAAAFGILTQDICAAECCVIDDDGRASLLVETRVVADLARRRALEKAARAAIAQVYADQGGMSPAQRLGYHLIVGSVAEEAETSAA